MTPEVNIVAIFSKMRPVLRNCIQSALVKTVLRYIRLSSLYLSVSRIFCIKSRFGDHASTETDVLVVASSASNEPSFLLVKSFFEGLPFCDKFCVETLSIDVSELPRI